MRIEYADNRGFALSSFPHHRCLVDEKKDRMDAISSFLVGEPFDERLMKNYPADCQMLAYNYHQIISLSDIINPTEQQNTSSAGRTIHTARQCTTDLMLAQVRVFPTGGKYRSLLGDFSSRTTEFVLKIPNRPKVLHPSGHPAKTVGSSRTRIETRAKRNRMSNETECQTNKT